MPANPKYSREQRKEAYELYWKGRPPSVEGERPRGEYTLMEIQAKIGMDFRYISLVARGLK